MSKNHYHVTFGTVGCMPDDNDLYETKSEALRYAVESAAELREHGRKVSGNARTGYAVDQINYLIVDVCNESACLADEYGDS